MSRPVQIVGSYLSPYVRKVLAFLDLKGIDYEIDPIVPFMGEVLGPSRDAAAAVGIPVRRARNW